MIQRLNYLALRAEDPAAAAAFAAEHMGFTLVHTADDGSTYLKALGPDPYSLVYTPGHGPGLDHASYLVRDEAALQQAADHLRGAGVKVEEIADPGWNHAPAIRFHTPAGHQLEFTTGFNTDVPVAHMASVNGASPGPIAPDHVGLSAPDFEAENAFATDVLGLLASSHIMAPGDVEAMTFLRAPGRFLYHCLVNVRGAEPVIHHYQISLKSVDAFYAAHEAITNSGVKIEWGPLRHGPGHNLAFYFQDGGGYWVEYSVEEEIITDDEHYLPRTWTIADPHVIDEWQTGPPPVAMLGPPPGEPDTPESAEIRKQVFARVGQMINKRLYVGLSKVNMTSPPPPIEVIGEHLKYALELEASGVLFAAGPFVDDDNNMVGDGLFILRAGSKAEAEAILAKDPIHLGKYRRCTVYGWNLHEGKLNVSIDLSTGAYALS
jgi:catechol 2,3-dioxygenase